MATLTKGIVQSILKEEDNDGRFEKFCVALYSKLDGVDYITTSATWDLGRDGRQASLFSREIFPVICSSLNTKIEEKASHDIQRLITTTDVSVLRFCTTQPLSEHARDNLTDELRTVGGSAKTIEADGLDQIEKIVNKNSTYSALFESYYSGEVADKRAALASREENNESTISGMRIALSTQLSADGASLRDDLLHNLVLSALADGRSKTQSAIAKTLSDSLYLGRIVYEGYISSALSKLESLKLADVSGKTFKITDQGKELVSKLVDHRLEMKTQGQQHLAAAILKYSSHTLNQTDFEGVWKIVQEELSALLYLNGMQTINALSALAEDRDTGVSGQVDLSERINRIGKKVAEFLSRSGRVTQKPKAGKNKTKNQKPLVIESPSPVAIEIGQAVSDVFHDKNTEMFAWFSKLCACFTAICSLGLSENSQHVLVRKLRKMDLYLDTDIVLSWLAEVELDHDKIVLLLDGWKKVGGKLNVARPVLEELAHHASISETDFREVYHRLANYNEDDARYLITNAFVRGYWALGRKMRKPYSVATWRQYIANFKGRNELDYSRIVEDLKASSFLVPSDDSIDNELANKISKQMTTEKNRISTTNNPQSLMKRYDKSDRDGRLVALVYGMRNPDKSGTAVIVSSSPLLAKTCRDLGLSSNGYPLVLPLGSIAYLLSLVPGSHISLFGLRNLLFDAKFHENITPLVRRALRLLNASEQYSLPFSRRASLDRELDSQIVKIAEQLGEKPSQLRERLATRTNETMDLMAEIVQKSVDAVAKSEFEDENIRLKAEIHRLQQELDKTKK